MAQSRPDPQGPAARTPVQVGERWENPVTRERILLLECPWDNPDGRTTVELGAVAGARVAAEHCHPAQVERWTVFQGELTLKRNGRTSVLYQGETATIEPGVWHRWWNAASRDARVRVEVTPGERFLHMIETFFGLARLGYADPTGRPSPMQLALTAREFRDVIVFRSRAPLVQRAIHGALAPIARWHGFRGTYPELSRAAPEANGGVCRRMCDVSTVYGIVTQRGGFMWVYSEPGAGATFKVYLPRVEKPVAVAAPPPSSAPLFGTETVLLAEDGSLVRTGVRATLARRGYTVRAPERHHSPRAGRRSCGRPGLTCHGTGPTSK